ncbi:MAG: nucleotidyltransferase family protein [Candidatus Omnitrophica bacterium]|nr:nucleotidyltransferase family protein [Candidatus Omnitrophota bacterium]
MKVLILAGGRGKRLGNMSEVANKCMLKVAGRPLIEYSLECAYRAGFREIDILVGYRAQEIKDVYGKAFRSIPIRYIQQKEQKGVVHAIECAKDTLQNEDFMLMLGDELLINPAHEKMVSYFSSRKDIFGLCGTVRVADRSLIRKTYAVISGQDKRIIRLIEKPQHPPNDWMGTGNILLRTDIFNYIPKTPVNQQRGERELPDLIQCAVDDGRIVEPFALCDRYVNVNSADELKTASSYFVHY